MKICSKCKEEKPKENFYKCLSSKDGYTYNCKDCKRLLGIEYREKNKEKLKEYKKEYNKKARKNYPEKHQEWLRNYRKNNKEKVNLNQREYRKDNSELKEKRNIYMKEKKKNDPVFKLKHRIRINIVTSIKNGGYVKKNKTEEILGCSFEEFKNHIESQFKEWMTFENHGKYNGEFENGWDLDHIIPLCIAKTEEETIKLNHFTNFQPLCSKINRDVKKGKILNLPTHLITLTKFYQ